MTPDHRPSNSRLAFSAGLDNTVQDEMRVLETFGGFASAESLDIHKFIIRLFTVSHGAPGPVIYQEIYFSRSFSLFITCFCVQPLLFQQAGNSAISNCSHTHSPISSPPAE